MGSSTSAVKKLDGNGISLNLSTTINGVHDEEQRPKIQVLQGLKTEGIKPLSIGILTPFEF